MNRREFALLASSALVARPDFAEDAVASVIYVGGIKITAHEPHGRRGRSAGPDVHAVVGGEPHLAQWCGDRA